MVWFLIGQICLKQVLYFKNLFAMVVRRVAKDTANAYEPIFVVQLFVHVLDNAADKKVCNESVKIIFINIIWCVFLLCHLTVDILLQDKQPNENIFGWYPSGKIQHGLLCTSTKFHTFITK